MKNNSYDLAKKYFLKADDFGDSEIYLSKIELEQTEQAKEKVYNKAVELYEEEKYAEALDLFCAAKDYKESEMYIQKCERKI